MHVFPKGAENEINNVQLLLTADIFIIKLHFLLQDSRCPLGNSHYLYYSYVHSSDGNSRVSFCTLKLERTKKNIVRTLMKKFAN